MQNTTTPRNSRATTTMRLMTFALFALAGAGCSADVSESGSDDEGVRLSEMGEAKLVFVSSERFSADLGGLEGADEKCQTLAEAAGRAGTYRAWLSTLSEPAHTRLTHASVPYVLRDGTLVADDWDDLTSGTLRAKINLTESAAPAPNAESGCNPHVFWSGTDEHGAQYGGECNGWTSNSAEDSAVLGVLDDDRPVWSTFCNSDCAEVAPLVCIEQ